MHTLSLLVVCATLVLSSVTAAPSWPPNPNWQAYVLATGAARLSPVRIVSTAGNITNAAGLMSGGSGPATLTWNGTGPAPTILLDYGKESSGSPVLTVTATSGRLFAPVLVRIAFSETQQFMTPTGDWGAAEDVHVENTGDNRSFTIYGGFRYQLIQFQNAGTVTLTAVRVEPKFENGDASKYQGWFLCSDDLLNKIWFSGAYTAQTNTLPVNLKFEFNSLADRRWQARSYFVEWRCRGSCADVNAGSRKYRSTICPRARLHSLPMRPPTDRCPAT